MVVFGEITAVADLMVDWVVDLVMVETDLVIMIVADLAVVAVDLVVAVHREIGKHEAKYVQTINTTLAQSIFSCSKIFSKQCIATLKRTHCPIRTSTFGANSVRGGIALQHGESVAWFGDT